MLTPHAILEAIDAALIGADGHGRVVYMNHAAETITGWRLVDAMGLALADVLQVKGASEPPYQVLVRRTGEQAPVEVSTSPVCDDRGVAVGSVTVCRDVGGAVALARDLSHRAQHDALTGLPNRLLLQDRLAAALAAGQGSGHVVAVCFLDVDGLKAVNDAFGHRMGDAVLTTVADRLRGAVRATDTVCRLGGDEFVIVLPHVAHRSDAAHMSKKLFHAVSQPVRFHGVTVDVAASLGIAIAPDHGRDPHTLIARADAAMYKVKRARAVTRTGRTLAWRPGGSSASAVRRVPAATAASAVADGPRASSDASRSRPRGCGAGRVPGPSPFAR